MTYQSLRKSPGSDFLTAPTPPKIKGRDRKLSVTEMMAMNARGGPDMSTITDAATGTRLSNTEAQERMPAGGYQVGWDAGRRRGGYGGGMPPRSRISSAGVAGGVSTSVRGRMEAELMKNPNLDPLMALEEAQVPAWQKTSEDWSENALDPSNPRYGNMGKPIVRAYARGTDDTGANTTEAIVGEKGIEKVILPPHSQVIPNSMLDSGWGETALDALTGTAPVPIANPYMGQPLAPSRDAFKTTPLDRYDDLSNRLAALRAEGLASGRARVLENTARQQAEMADREKFLASGEPIPTADGGGALYRTKYGTAIVGGNRPKSFTVENFEGGQTTSPNLAEVDRESRTDAAERTVRGLGLNRYVGYGAPRQSVTPPAATPPAAIDEIVPPTPAVPAIEAPVLAARGAADVVSGARDIAPPPKDEKQIVKDLVAREVKRRQDPSFDRKKHEEETFGPTAIDEVEEDMSLLTDKELKEKQKLSPKELANLKAQGFEVEFNEDGTVKTIKKKLA